MPNSRPINNCQRHRRRWAFDNCVFDEGNWSLWVDGRRVPVETKPLELLRELLVADGDLVSKGELLDRIWPDVMVVEASLPTAVRKLRLALNDEARTTHVIETVPRIGYRLGVRADVQESEPVRQTYVFTESSSVNTNPAARQLPAFIRKTTSTLPGLLSIAGALGIAAVLSASALAPSQRVRATAAPRIFTQRDAANALRKLDVGTIEQMLAAGWNPNKPFDNQGNDALNYVLNKCEWDRGHDQEQMLLVVRTLIDGGARLDHRNVWGDTPYSIAKAVRYCGPNHPVTRSIRTMCYAGFKPLGDRCLASYELTRS